MDLFRFLYSLLSIILLSVFIGAIFFVPIPLQVMCRPFGPSQALPRIIQGMVTLLIHDPIRTLLSRHVITVNQGDHPLIEGELHSTATQVVTRETVHITTRVDFKGMGRVPHLTRRIPLRDLDQINLATLAVLMNSRHVINGNSLIDIKDHQRE